MQSVLANCEMMNEHLNVAWEVIGDDLVVEMMGAIGKLRLECIKIVAFKYQRSLLICFRKYKSGPTGR